MGAKLASNVHAHTHKNSNKTIWLLSLFLEMAEARNCFTEIDRMTRKFVNNTYMLFTG
jgi:hypothetical protein